MVSSRNSRNLRLILSLSLSLDYASYHDHGLFDGSPAVFNVMKGGHSCWNELDTVVLQNPNRGVQKPMLVSIFSFIPFVSRIPPSLSVHMHQCMCSFRT